MSRPVASIGPLGREGPEIEVDADRLGIEQVPGTAPMTTTRRLTISLAVFALLVVGGCVVLPLSCLVFPSLFDDWRHRRAFDAGLWRSQEMSQHNLLWPPRLCMADDLLAHGHLRGKTQSQVVELLGPPSDKMVLPGTTACQISYYL
jgi:hypothetical protein